jgi:hypothetical protein
MNPAFVEIGTGHYNTDSSTYRDYWTQEFGAQAVAWSSPTPVTITTTSEVPWR